MRSESLTELSTQLISEFSHEPGVNVNDCREHNSVRVIIHVFSKVNTSNGYNEVRYRTTLTEFSSLPCGLLGSLVHDLSL